MVVLLGAPRLINSTATQLQLTFQLLLLGMVAIFLLTGWAGVLLYTRSAWGSRLAAGLQLLQIPVFSAGALRWVFFAGAYVVPYWQRSAGWSVAIGLTADVEWAWRNPEGSALRGINLVPLVILYFLLRRLPSSEAMPLTTTAAVAAAGDASE